MSILINSFSEVYVGRNIMRLVPFLQPDLSHSYKVLNSKVLAKIMSIAYNTADTFYLAIKQTKKEYCFPKDTNRKRQYTPKQ